MSKISDVVLKWITPPEHKNLPQIVSDSDYLELVNNLHKVIREEIEKYKDKQWIKIQGKDSTNIMYKKILSQIDAANDLKERLTGDER